MIATWEQLNQLDTQFVLPWCATVHLLSVVSYPDITRLRYRLSFDLSFFVEYDGGASTVGYWYRTGASSGMYLVFSWFAAPVGVTLLLLGALVSFLLGTLAVFLLVIRDVLVLVIQGVFVFIIRGVLGTAVAEWLVSVLGYDLVIARDR